MKPCIKVERQMTVGTWYEVMLSPFHTEEQAWDYINKYRHRYPVEEQNYRITKPIENSEVVHYWRKCWEEEE